MRRNSAPRCVGFHAIKGRSGNTARARCGGGRDEAGAVLVLALVFLLVGIIVVGGLLNALTNDLSSSNSFKSVRSLQYAARSATDLAIESIRYTPLLSTGQTLNASPPSYCWGSGPVSELAGIDGVSEMAVWCSTVWNPTSADTRVVTFSACLGSVSAPQCALQPVLQAVVTFDDYPPGISAPTTAECVVYCGASMALDSWQWSPVVPTVTGIMDTVSNPPSTSGPITGGTQVTITGTGFVNGATVDFVEESLGTPTSDNVVLPAPATTVHVVGSTSITADSPAVTEGSTYYVTVTTLMGTSAYGSSDVFGYVSTTPTVTGISPDTGLVGGGNAVAITGTGFFNGATVIFAEESGGVLVSPTVTLTATYVSVTGSTTITAVSPPVTSVGTYFVTVETPAGTSAPGVVCTSYPNTPGTPCDTFEYGTLVPTVDSFTPTTGPTGRATTVTITGAGFDGGATTVSLLQESNGTAGTNSYAATNVTVNESGVTGTSTMTAVVPSSVPAGTYFVTATTPQGTSSPGGTSDIFTVG